MSPPPPRADWVPAKHLQVLILPLERSLTLTLSPEFNKAIITTLALFRGPLFANGGAKAGAKPSGVFAFPVFRRSNESPPHASGQVIEIVGMDPLPYLVVVGEVCDKETGIKSG